MGKTIFQALFSFIFVLLLLFPNLFASWGLIDDHQIIRNLGSDEKMGFSEIPEKLKQTEVFFTKERITRYRPAYWVANLTETAIWGGKAENWYRFRLLLIGTSIFITWYLLSKNIGLALSGIACLYLFTLPSWADTWTRLGPSELYALFGFAIYCLAFYKIWTYKSAKWWLLLAFGAILSFGSKENFLFLLPATVPLVYRIWKSRKLTLLPAACTIFIMFSGLSIAVAVIVMLSRTGADIYGNSVNPAARFLPKLLARPNQIAAIPVLVSAVLLGGVFFVRKRVPSLHSALPLLKKLFLAEVLLFTVWISQFFFYNGGLPFWNRYDFPGLFARDLGYFFLFSIPFALLSIYKFRFNIWIKSVSLIALTVCVWFFFAGPGFMHIQNASVENLKKTQSFTKSVHKMIAALKNSPDIPVILHAHTVWDYEPVISFSRYIQTYGAINPVALFFEEQVIAEHMVEVERMLLKRMEGISKTGDVSKIDDRLNFVSVNSVAGRPCFVVDFSGVSTRDCFNLGRIW